jgi:hypothetical protein
VSPAFHLVAEKSVHPAVEQRPLRDRTFVHIVWRQVRLRLETLADGAATNRDCRLEPSTETGPRRRVLHC